jgi:pimeloyl-ACP methyl ester carboxylesterase
MHRLAERLGRSYRVLAVHLPGDGRTAPIDPYAMAHSHALVEETLAARGVREAHLVGFAGGAYRAFALAVRGNLVVRSIASLGGAADFTDEERTGLVQYVAMLRAGVDAAPVLVDLVLSPRGRENAMSVADVRSWAAAITEDDLARELEAFIAAPDLRPQLAELEIPVLVRVGSIDAASPPERSRRIAEVARRSRLEEVPGVGHALLCEDFDSTLASVERHLLDAVRALNG